MARLSPAVIPSPTAFARDIVLTGLGEDPGGYQQVQDELARQLRPGNLLECHYVEKIAAAS